jgi:cytochrome b subunit of formate dehydrogenase
MNRFFSTVSTIGSGVGMIAGDLAWAVISFVMFLFSVCWMVLSFIMEGEKEAAKKLKKPGA